MKYYLKKNLCINNLILLIASLLIISGFFLFFKNINYISAYLLIIQINFFIYAYLAIYFNNRILSYTNFFFLIFYIFPASYLGFDFKFINFYILNLDKQSISVFFYHYNVICLLTFIIKLKSNFKMLTISNEKIFIKIKNVSILILIIYFLINYFHNQFNINPRFYTNIFLTIFDIDRIVFFLTSIYFFLDEKIKKKNFNLIIILFFIYIFNGIFFLGSKSPVLQILLNFFIFFIIGYDNFVLKVKHIILLFIITIPLFFISHVIGSAVRKINLNSYLDRNVSLFSEIKTNLIIVGINNVNHIDFFGSLINIFQSIIYRFNYFNLYINNFNYLSDLKQAQIITLKIYLFSIADKLSPGFDFFKVGLSKNNLYDLKYGLSNSSNSNQLTPFLELELLFGKFSFVFIFILYYLFKKIILKSHKLSNITKILVYSNILLLLSYIFLGAGIDLMIVKSVYFVMFNIIMYLLVKINYEKVKSFAYNFRLFK
jgi:hypothetical protein